eukprot:CAMPEP_0204248646 /NCGR_PEP_ID=MMETSP0361-20130328/99269_1 /ASSEMBLY_ACC=CAM_ASM_000343 /TAXON_ID=268821 /ORGANISM="Scrippsiella Hangoei, Strain SHTV-5" /LENGTH=336 /DNA_ID=CAMNT_0051221913 /DNA_START=107 /DNA_END=1119 /DNA_ORIENTATION=-
MTLFCLALAAAQLVRWTTTFAVAPSSERGAAAASPRRGALMATLSTALWPVLGCAPALAAEAAPSILFMSGMPEAHANANGVWRVAGGKINERAVYTNQDKYLVVNGGLATTGRSHGDTLDCLVALLGCAPSLAAEAAPSILFLSGLPEVHANANGVWRVAGGKINERAVYTNQDKYLVVNDCGKLQINDRNINSGCDAGFARQLEKGKWVVDGQELDGQIKVKPAKVFGGSGKGTTVVVQSEFISDDDLTLKLVRGQLGTTQGIDEDGDASVIFEGTGGALNFVVKENFGNLLQLEFSKDHAGIDEKGDASASFGGTGRALTHAVKENLGNLLQL